MANETKHGVSFEEAATALEEPGVSFWWLTPISEEAVRLISARLATRK